MGKSEPILDLDYLDSISGNDAKFKHEVLDIFLSNTPQAVQELNDLIFNTNDLEAIYKQAHYLKSGFSVIRVSNVMDLLINIEKMSKDEGEIAVIREKMDELNKKFLQALPLIISEKDKNKKM
jgi:hypothetical protein